MKKIFLIGLMVGFVYLGNTQGTYNNNLAIKTKFLDYQSQNGGNFTAFRKYSQAVEVSYAQRLTDQVKVGLPVFLGITRDSMGRNRELIYGGDLNIQYHFIKPNSRLIPYVFVGAGLAVREELGEAFQFPLGLGLNFRVNERAFISWASSYRFSLAENSNNLHHGLGVMYTFGKGAKVKKETELAMADSDGDGIADDIDLCPQVAGPAALNGCPDSDGDGVADYRDACPDIAGLKSLRGCPDSDGDGLSDNEDECPKVSGPIENKGCPVVKEVIDTDKDGIPDEEDKCPTKKGTEKAEGCPDTDDDGVPDHQDRCPTEKGSPRADGCPDTDGDGVADFADKCPMKAGIPAYQGCPDTDGDGLHDGMDRCPNTAGPVSNDGCPEIQKEDKQTLDVAMRSVQFETGKATLKVESYKILSQIVTIMNKYPDYSLVINGHTDNTGTASNNQVLSENRAKACYEFLIGSGVDPSRLSYTGYGESRPVASNDTLRGRALNRRVEFSLVPTN
jgi:outer membrane protein OmpA-like peptidoglycan-associated protein